jgi:hypothetical protein
MMQDMRVASRQPLPARLAQNTPTTTTTVVRSVLDDNLTTASVSGRAIILDPCTGQEKK